MANYLRMYHRTLHQILSIDSHKSVDDQSDIWFAIAQGSLLW